MGTALAVAKSDREVARPLKILVPLISEELEAGNHAGLEHYRQAGAMLSEARSQVAPYKWGKWLSKNFDLSSATAYRYMKLAEMAAKDSSSLEGETNLHRTLGYDANQSRSTWRRIADAARKIDREDFMILPKNTTDKDEIRLHRELAEELIDIGYRALATRLHPDRGGNKDAMRRLNRVRDDLKSLASTRRFL